MDFSDNTTQIILAVIAIFAVGAFLVIKNKKNNKVNQKNITIHGDGDVVGRDKKATKE